MCVPPSTYRRPLPMSAGWRRGGTGPAVTWPNAAYRMLGCREVVLGSPPARPGTSVVVRPPNASRREVVGRRDHVGMRGTSQFGRPLSAARASSGCEAEGIRPLSRTWCDARGEDGRPAWWQRRCASPALAPGAAPWPEFGVLARTGASWRSSAWRIDGMRSVGERVVLLGEACEMPAKSGKKHLRAGEAGWRRPRDF